MRVPESQWLDRLQKATRTDGPSSTENAVDKNLVKAGDDIFTKAAQAFQAVGGSPAEAAERLWTARGQDGVPGLAERIITDGTDKDTLTSIHTSSIEDLNGLIDQLAVRMLAGEGREEELHRLLELKSVAGSGSRIIPEYNRAVRSLLAHQRTATAVDPKIGPALRAIGDRVALEYAKAQTVAATETLRDGAVTTSNKLWSLGAQALKEIKSRATGESQIAKSVQKAVADIKGMAASLLPDGVLEKLEEAKVGAETLVDSIGGIGDVKDDREVAARFMAALPSVAETLDGKADAVAVGMLKETAALVTGSSGHEVVYVRETGELHVNELKGVGGRLGVGGTLRAFTRNAYGDVANDDSDRRSGYELGIVCGHLGVYGGKGEDAPRGWHSTFSLGFNASIPLLADQSVFDVKETRVHTVKLAQAEIDKIEAQLAGTSETAQSWHETMRSKTGVSG